MRISAGKLGWAVVTLLVASTFVMLGRWQLERASEKRELSTSFQKRGEAARINLNNYLFSEKPAEEMAGYRVNVDGRYADNDVFLDNQVHEGRVGYMVYTPLMVAQADYAILINRGWIAMSIERHRLPATALAGAADQTARINGRASGPAVSGLALSGSEQVENMGLGSFRVQRIKVAELGEMLGVRLAPYTILLAPDAKAGFVREWRIPGSGQERHLGYAFQWFALAAAVVVLCAVLLWREAK
jgi:surfeit locus 1 family protein